MIKKIMDCIVKLFTWNDMEICKNVRNKSGWFYIVSVTKRCSGKYAVILYDSTLDLELNMSEDYDRYTDAEEKAMEICNEFGGEKA